MDNSPLVLLCWFYFRNSPRRRALTGRKTAPSFSGRQVAVWSNELFFFLPPPFALVKSAWSLFWVLGPLSGHRTWLACGLLWLYCCIHWGPY